MKFVDNKGKETKENNKFPQRIDDVKNKKKDEITKPDSDLVNEIQISDTDSSLTTGENDDSVEWRSLPEILESSKVTPVTWMTHKDYM